MKKVLLICALATFSMLICGVRAQDIYAEASSFSTTERGIIRENQIAYYEDGGQGYFIYLPTFSLPSFNRVKIPPTWSIRDFHVINDTAYFCGTDKNDQTALLGHFAISNLVSGLGSTINFHRDNNIRTKMAILNRIAVHKDKVKNTVSVMAIGRAAAGIDANLQGSDRVVYLEDYASTAGCIFDNPANPNEVFWDVVLTDNYFVAAGTDTSDNKTLTMRKVPIGTVLSAFQSVFSNKYYYPCSYTFLSGVRATPIVEDEVVMSAYFDNPISPDIWMHLFTIDVQSVQMNYHQMHASHTSPTKVKQLPPWEMTYLPDSTALMVIDSFAHGISQNNHRILRLTPYPTVAIGSFYIPPFYNRVKNTNSDSIIFNSITTITNSCCMAAAGDSWLILDLLSPLFPLPGNTNGCIFTYTTDCFREPVYTSNEIAEGNSVLYNRAMRLEPGYIWTVEPESPCRPRSIFPAEFEPVKPTE
ncbi:MAG: hypothetical protein IJM33_00195 [Bacteroidales bacterium]|nr:hypothetical protein [Bacteroidales bacterium]